MYVKILNISKSYSDLCKNAVPVLHVPGSALYIFHKEGGAPTQKCCEKLTEHGCNISF